MQGSDKPEAVGVRHLRRGDREQWQALWDGYLSFYRARIPTAVSDLTFERLCEQQNGMVGLVAVDAGDHPIGLAHLVFHAATWSAAGYCYLEDLYVERSHRGGRIAEAIFAAVFAEARDRGVPRVYWHTQQFNGPARSLYDTVGHLTSFVVYERDVDAVP